MTTDAERQAEQARADALRAEIAPFMESAREWVRSLGYNRVEKIAERSFILNQEVPSSFAPGISESEKIVRRNRWCEKHARYDALKELEGECHLTPARRQALHQQAKEKLPKWARYAFAAKLAHDLESDHEIEPSETARRMEECAKERHADVSDALSYALTEAEIQLLRAISASRRSRRFRIVRTRGSEEFDLLDVMIKAPYAFEQFAKVVEYARTIADVKSLCAMWATTCRVERRDGVSIILGEGFEIYPAN